MKDWLMEHKFKLTVFLLSIGTLILITSYYSIPLVTEDYGYILLYLIMIVLIDSLPLRVNQITITLNGAVILAVFLRYGVAVEVWLTLISLAVTLTITSRRPIERIIMNLSMFTWVFLGASTVYLLAGGQVGSDISINENLMPIFLYVVTAFLINHLAISYIIFNIYKQKILANWHSMKWDVFTNILAVPLAALLYLVHRDMGVTGMIFVLIPTLTISYVLKLYSDLKNAHLQMGALNDVSSKFTSELDLNKTISLIQDSIEQMVDVEYSYIFESDSQKMFLKPLAAKHIDNRPIDDWDQYYIPVGHGLSGKVAGTGEPMIVHRLKSAEDLESDPAVFNGMESLMVVPMIAHDELMGVMMLGSSKALNYSNWDLNLIHILANQAAIAIENAKLYQSTERRSQIDELTGVYNYRTFDTKLQQLINHAKHEEQLVSLMIMDIDHFKTVNDLYGHLAGNEVLVQLANIIQANVRKEDIVARYGGEEFTVILPYAGEAETADIAERIRYAIESTPMKIMNNIQRPGESSIHVTMSIGVATFPDQADSPLSLIRHADRAMYIGSKRGGRNKVSIYRAG
jgi:two-component system cell cycle response regulator